MFCRLSQQQNAFSPIVLTDCGTTTLVTPAGKHIKVSFALLYKAVPSDSKYLLPASTKIDFKALQPEKMLITIEHSATYIADAFIKLDSLQIIAVLECKTGYIFDGARK